MKCVKCNSENKVKRGFVKGKQRFTCKDCGYNYTVEQKTTAKSNSTKRQALQMYLEGLGFRSIGRILNVSHVSVYNWIKSFGSKVEDIKSGSEVDIVEIDEMHSYVGDKKNYCWIWIAVDRLGKRFINFVVGDRSSTTGIELWNRIKEKDIGMVATDYWKAYNQFVPDEIHVQSKAETFTVEGYNSLFRHFLARMRRKTKCYSKSIDRLREAMAMLILKRNNQLDILN
ncbi:MAG: IS1 family transposase [Chitinophagaceae bacterium]